MGWKNKSTKEPKKKMRHSLRSAASHLEMKQRVCVAMKQQQRMCALQSAQKPINSTFNPTQQTSLSRRFHIASNNVNMSSRRRSGHDDDDDDGDTDNDSSTSLGERMKAYEEKTNIRMDLTARPFMVRLDGNSFSTFTKPFVKPFDPECMYG